MNWQLFVGSLFLITQIHSQLSLCNYEHNRYVTHPTSQLCQFVYGMNSDCIALDFRFCRFRGKCLSNQTQNCSEYQVLNSQNYTDCLQQCCPVFETEDPKLYTSMKCDSKPQIAFSSSKSQLVDLDSESYSLGIEKDIKTILVIILFVLVFIVLMLFLILKCIRRDRQNQQNQQVRRDIPLSQRQLNPILKNIDKIISKDWERLPNRVRQPQQNPEMKDNCTICLNQYPNATLDCGHQFHKGCIYEWLSRNYSCPLCKSSAIKTIQLKCSKCLSYGYHCKTTQLKASMQTQDICNCCRKYGIR